MRSTSTGAWTSCSSSTRVRVPSGSPSETLTLRELDGIDVPVVPRAHLLLHVAARLEGGERKARLQGIVDAYALVDDDNDMLHRAATLCPSPIVSARLHLLAGVVRAVNPACPGWASLRR